MLNKNKHNTTDFLQMLILIFLQTNKNMISYFNMKGKTY